LACRFFFSFRPKISRRLSKRRQNQKNQEKKKDDKEQFRVFVVFTLVSPLDFDKNECGVCAF